MLLGINISISWIPKIVIKPEVFWCYQGIQKKTGEMKWVNASSCVKLLNVNHESIDYRANHCFRDSAIRVCRKKLVAWNRFKTLTGLSKIWITDQTESSQTENTLMILEIQKYDDKIYASTWKNYLY